MIALWIFLALVAVVLMVLLAIKTIQIIPQARAANVERLGRFRRTMRPGVNFIVPFLDRVKPLIDLREQVVSFQGQRVITEDNLVVHIDTVLFFQVTDPRAADYEIVDYAQAIDQLSTTMLRSVIGSMDLGADPGLPRQDQQHAARRARRGVGQVGHPGHPGGDQGPRPGVDHHGRDGTAVSRATGETRRHPVGGRCETGGDLVGGR